MDPIHRGQHVILEFLQILIQKIRIVLQPHEDMHPLEDHKHYLLLLYEISHQVSLQVHLDYSKKVYLFAWHKAQTHVHRVVQD